MAFGVSSVKADEADEQMIKDMQRDAAYMDPTRAAAMLSRSQGDAMKAAASNTATGPAMAFMGMGMAGQVGGVNAQDLYAMGRQQAAQQPAAEQAQQPAAQAAFEEPVATNPYGFTAEQALTTTDQMQIAQIAQYAPELRACIARNPNTYPALIEWLGQLGDPAINAALASRQ